MITADDEHILKGGMIYWGAKLWEVHVILQKEPNHRQPILLIMHNCNFQKYPWQQIYLK
jgi:hypothetical protein